MGCSAPKAMAHNAISHVPVVMCRTGLLTIQSNNTVSSPTAIRNAVYTLVKDLSFGATPAVLLAKPARHIRYRNWMCQAAHTHADSSHPACTGQFAAASGFRHRPHRHRHHGEPQFRSFVRLVAACEYLDFPT